MLFNPLILFLGKYFYGDVSWIKLKQAWHVLPPVPVINIALEQSGVEEVAVNQAPVQARYPDGCYKEIAPPPLPQPPSLGTKAALDFITKNGQILVEGPTL